MRFRLGKDGAVDCRATLEVPLSAISVWGQIRDFHRYARHDFFHAELTIEGGIPRVGARLTLCHRYAAVRITRIGRILIWREGIGFSFSDISLRGPRAGFPHVFGYRIEATGKSTCRLHLRVSGKWTARPRWIARLWLRWVFASIVRNVSNELMIYRIWRESRVRLGGALADAFCGRRVIDPGLLRRCPENASAKDIAH